MKIRKTAFHLDSWWVTVLKYWNSPMSRPREGANQVSVYELEERPYTGIIPLRTS